MTAILTIIGSLGLFLFGMKLLSETLQRATGSGIRRAMEPMTGSTARRILSGTLITSAVQSSSAVTVMVVSFVNAGLVNLRQAVGLIMGANIGTTITAWLICIFGFGLNLGSIAVPLAGLGFVLILIKNSRYKSGGVFVMGVALLFLGLNILQNTLSEALPGTVISGFLAQYSTMGYSSNLLFLLVGILLTALVQSSSATFLLTMIMCSKGWLPLEAGAAMILGENIGTTITANLASVVANTNAKRAALSHTIINVVGVIWMMPVLPFAVSGVVWLLVRCGVDLMMITPVALALFHTLFNVVNILLLSSFSNHIAKFTIRLLPSSGEKDTGKRLMILNSGMLSTSELSVVQAQGEVLTHAKRTIKMFAFVRSLYRQSDGAEFERTFLRIEKYATIADKVQREIIGYLAEVSRGDLSSEAAIEIQKMFGDISHIKIIAQANLSIAQTLRRKREAGVWFNQDLRDKFSGMLDLQEQMLYLMASYIDAPEDSKSEKIKGVAQEIDIRYATFLQEQINLNQQQDYKQGSSFLFFELIKECEKISNSVVGITAQ